MIDDLLDEIQNYLPTDVEEIIPPFSTDADRDEKFKAASMALRRSIKLKNRFLSLVNAYYLGKILNEFETSTEKFLHKR